MVINKNWFRPVPGTALLLLAQAACGDGIERDADGCWLDGHQAHEQMGLRICDEACYPESDDGSMAACVEYWQGLEESHRSDWCFNGCAGDACFEAWDQYLQSCTETDHRAYFIECYGDQGLFWGSSSNADPEGEECIGW